MMQDGVVRWTRADARAALTRLVARRARRQLYVERLLAQKTCPACWRTIGFGMLASDLRQPVAHAIGCEAAARGRVLVRYRADPTMTILIRAARGETAALRALSDGAG